MFGLRMSELNNLEDSIQHEDESTDSPSIPQPSPRSASSFPLPFYPCSKSRAIKYIVYKQAVYLSQHNTGNKSYFVSRDLSEPLRSFHLLMKQSVQSHRLFSLQDMRFTFGVKSQLLNTRVNVLKFDALKVVAKWPTLSL
jgi:hypothetical protein